MSSDCNYIFNIEKIFCICSKWIYLCYMKKEQEMNLRDVSIRISELSYKKRTLGITDTEQRELEVLSNWIKERYR